MNAYGFESSDEIADEIAAMSKKDSVETGLKSCKVPNKMIDFASKLGI